MHRRIELVSGILIILCNYQLYAACPLPSSNSTVAISQSGAASAGTAPGTDNKKTFEQKTLAEHLGHTAPETEQTLTHRQAMEYAQSIMPKMLSEESDMNMLLKIEQDLIAYQKFLIKNRTPGLNKTIVENAINFYISVTRFNMEHNK